MTSGTVGLRARLLHVIRSVNPAGGGPIEGVKQIMAAHARQGCEGEVLTLDAPDDAAVRQFPFSCFPVGPVAGGYGYSSRLVPWIRGNRRRFDAVVVHGLWQYSSFGTWRALAGTSTPYYVFPHGMLDPWFKRTYPLKHAKKWLYWPWAEYRVLRDARRVLFTTEEERRLASRSFWLYRCQEGMVGFGAADPGADGEWQRSLFLKRFPEAAGKRCLVFLGRVHVKKGPDLVLRAFAELLRIQPAIAADVVLVMAGPHDDEFGRSMVRLAQELNLSPHVIWTGMLTGEVKWGALRVADAFILPSHQENFGVAVVEALACHVPVLISKEVNIWPQVVEEEAGFADVDDLAGTIQLLHRWLSTDAETWRTMRTRARRAFERRFNIEHTAAALLRLIGAM